MKTRIERLIVFDVIDSAPGGCKRDGPFGRIRVLTLAKKEAKIFNDVGQISTLRDATRSELSFESQSETGHMRQELIPVEYPGNVFGLVSVVYGR